MTKALIVVDVQNDFITGSLKVPGGQEVIRPINNIISSGDYETIIFTQDWHPKDHCSFKVWPPHCIQGTKGAAFAPHLNHKAADLIIRKGTKVWMDAYSPFVDHAANTSGLGGFLGIRGIVDVDVVGLALDYCVKETAYDAYLRGHNVTVIKEATKAVDPYAGEAALDFLKTKNIRIS